MFEGSASYLLLALVAAAAWALGRAMGRTRRGHSEPFDSISENYFLGLNYLLNDEPDEAIDTFIKSLEVNSDTADTHLALGALLRRRGKVDKAIRVHQSLLAWPGLSQQVIDSSRLQLASDYITAGLLDRAERLLQEILEENSGARWQALQRLITVYQTEKEWQPAIDCSRKLLENPDFKRNREIRSAAAHYCCELAETELRHGRKPEARSWLARAFNFDRRHVRASLLVARVEAQLGNHRLAIKELQRIWDAHPDLRCELLAPMRESSDALGQMVDYKKRLQEAFQHNRDSGVLLELCDLLQDQGDPALTRFLQQAMAEQASLPGLAALLKLQSTQVDEELGDSLERLRDMIENLLSRRAAYLCSHCGFEARNLYWLCPSCQKWDCMKPVPES